MLRWNVAIYNTIINRLSKFLLWKFFFAKFLLFLVVVYHRVRFMAKTKNQIVENKKNNTYLSNALCIAIAIFCVFAYWKGWKCWY